MKVYIAFQNFRYEGGDKVLAVCATRELAQQRIADDKERYCDGHTIEEWEVEGLPPS